MKSLFISQNGSIKLTALLVIVTAVGLMAFLLVSSTSPFNGGIFNQLFQKPISQAAPLTGPLGTPVPTPIPGDIDGNGIVNIFDYNIIVTNFGKSGSGIPGDIDGNGKVDIFDYNIIVTNFGKSN